MQESIEGKEHVIGFDGLAEEPSKQFTPGRGALATLVLVAMLNVMGGAAVALALPAISDAYPEASEAVVSLVITLPSLAVALSGLFVGAIADRVGKARALPGLRRGVCLAGTQRAVYTRSAP